VAEPRAKRPLDLTPAAVDVASERIEQQAPAARAVRWNFILVWFMRATALLWIVQGLSAWASIMNLLQPDPLFEARPVGQQATLIFFAVVDPIAAVGLWLTSTWGGVLWLLAVMSHVILALLFPRLVPGDVLTLSLFGILVVAYLSISWLAATDEQ
jgi:hypothetical protein